MREEIVKALKSNPFLFFDDWPQQIQCSKDDQPICFENNEVRKYRLQMVLAASPLGIPSLAFCNEYKKMFGKVLKPEDLGYLHLSEMVASLPQIFAVQEPDEVTALLFPDYPTDKILHDARIERNFDLDQVAEDYTSTEFDTLISSAWLNRDPELPVAADVVLAGEQYSDLILPMSAANIPESRGVYQAIITGAANPDHFFVNIKSSTMDRIINLSHEVKQFFRECNRPMEDYSVPDEFLYRGFPCLVYLEEQDIWERAAVISRKSHGNKVVIETVDYGGLQTVDKYYLYLMPRRFFDIPKQGILVSMAGIKPYRGDDEWSPLAAVRLRCFSNIDYFLDCLLLKPKEIQDNLGQKDSSADEDKKVLSRAEKKKLMFHREPQFEIILYDRHDDEMHLYLDDVLCLETYASPDLNREKEINNLKERFSRALAEIPPPDTPLRFK